LVWLVQLLDMSTPIVAELQKMEDGIIAYDAVLQTEVSLVFVVQVVWHQHD
jgi:hypothetical protein